MSPTRPVGGRGLLLLRATSAALVLSGLCVLLLGVSGRFLPHDEAFLGMTAEQLCAVNGCRVVHFMAHDRVAFGGAVVSVGLLYLWLVEVPLRQGQRWAWWALALSGAVGFASFFAYLGYGYLDTWHGVVTLGLLPCYLLGLIRARAGLTGSEGRLLRPSAGFGRLCLLAAAAGLALGGLVVMVVGMTCVFVPQDLAYMGLEVADLDALNPRLVPLIAHDRAGFGGAVCSCGVALFFCVRCGERSGGLWAVLALVGLVGFGSAIGVHPAVGYNDVVHLAPALVGALTYAVGLALTFGPMAGRARPLGVEGS